MNKKQKIDYIESVRARIQDAPNHGHNGSSWWHPTQWTVAYDVKMHCRTKTIDDMRAIMTPVQDKYYSDDALYDTYYVLLEQECEQLRDTLLAMPRVDDVRFAGRSGGWCEVTYTGIDDVEQDLSDTMYTMRDIEEVYKQARALDRAEQDVRDTIEKAHTGLCEYLNTDTYVRDTVGNLLQDSAIVSIYQSKVDEYKALV